jgi:hypothetical protein
MLPQVGGLNCILIPRRETARRSSVILDEGNAPAWWDKITLLLPQAARLKALM